MSHHHHRADDRPARVVVEVGGALDATTAGELDTTLRYVVLRARDAVVLDLREVGFLSLRVARSLPGTKLMYSTHDLDLRLVAGRRKVERVLTVTGVRPLFRFYPTLAESLHS
jgi:anti-anti-sigma factor